jgi:preprotein translocase subunit SecF
MANFGNIANRLYRGEANLNIVGKRRLWFGVAGGVVAVSILALIIFGFKPGIEFSGGNEFQVPVRAGSLAQVEQVVTDAVHEVLPDAQIHTGQQIGDGSGAVYSVRTATLSDTQTTQVHEQIASKLGLETDEVIGSRVSASWGEQVSQQALTSLVIFLIAVTAYLSVRFEWRMAAAAVASLVFNLIATAAVYSIVGFEVSPATVIGFLTILGFALYDVVVVFDKVQENTRGITGKSNETYAEATNLALNQTFMRSINTSLVALLPVGGLLFIGAGLLGAGTLKDLGLVLFIGMGMAVYSSLFFAAPFLVWLKEMEPAIANHTKRVLARRAAPKVAAEAPAQKTGAPAPALAAVAPKAGAKPAQAKSGGTKSGGAKPGVRPARPGGKRR